MTTNSNVDVIRLWQLPDDFFSLDLDAQWRAIKAVTDPATPLNAPRRPCPLSLRDEVLALSFFVATLMLPFALAGATVWSVVYGTARLRLAVLAVALILAFHPLPQAGSLAARCSPMARALGRYFSLELFVDRDDHLAAAGFTPDVDKPERLKEFLPTVYLACPHGVFPYGAIVWCCYCRWGCGIWQYTGAASVVKRVPGLRYMHSVIWIVSASKRSIVKALRERCPVDSQGGERRGGVLGIPPDGILGAFRSRPGVDELVIGKRRGLMRLCLAEGAQVHAAFFFGTSDLLTVVQDPWGLMETLSRKMRAGVMGFYGRWFLPIPRRVALSVCVAPVRTTKTASPSIEDVERLHQEVYGRLKAVYDAQKAFAGYSDRELVVS